MSLSMLIDPGGSGSRPGINLVVYPEGDNTLTEPSDEALDRTGAGNLIAGGFSDIQEFTFSCTLGSTDYAKLLGLLNWQKEARRSLQPFEVVVYNLTEPFYENTPTRTRYLAPGTVVLQQLDMGSGYFTWGYYVALQGSINLVDTQRYGDCHRVTLAFQEGTKLTSSMEL